MEGRGGGTWLLLCADKEQDILRVLQWNDMMAQRPEIYHVCGAAHARQIVCEHALNGRLPVKRSAEAFDIQETLISDEYPWMLRHDERQLQELADAIEDLLEEEYASAEDSGQVIQFDA